MRKPILVAAAAGIALVASGAGAAAAVTWTDPATAYGGCVSKTSGYVRILERTNLTKSVFGACQPTETKISFFSRTGGQGPKGAAGAAGPAVKSWTWTADGKTYSCTDTDKDLEYTCSDS